MKKYLFFLSLCLFSCKDEVIGDVVPLVELANINITYQCVGDFINLEIDVLGDVTDELGVNNTFDYFIINVDYASNGVIDYEEDMIISNLEDGRICQSIYKELNVWSACDFSDNWTGLRNFGATPLLETPHVSYSLQLSKEVLSNSNKANIIIHLFDVERGFSYFPQEDIDFTRTLELNW